MNCPHVLGDRFQRGIRPADAPDVGAREADGIKEIGEGDEAQRLERAPLDGHRRQNRRQIVGRLQRKPRIAVEVLDPFGGGRQQLAHAMRIGVRLELRQARRAERRQRKTSDEIDDLIPFEGAERAGMHHL